MKILTCYKILFLYVLCLIVACTDGVERSYLQTLKTIEEHDRGYELNDVELENLQDNIQQALNSAEVFLQDSIIKEDDFVNYVLPAQVNSAEDISWRSDVHKRFGRNCIISMPFSYQDFKDSCTAINKRIGREFSFGLAPGPEETMSYSALLKNKQGSCVGMTHLAAYTFRALGVPVSIDFVPVWGNVNTYGHQWNVLLSEKGHIPFMGAESGIGDYEPLVISRDGDDGSITYRVPPKVYRECKLCEGRIEFMDRQVIDVTHEYVSVGNVIVEGPKSDEGMDLAVYTKGHLLPVASGIERDNGYMFRDMGVGLLYFPVSGGRAPGVLGFPIYNEKKGEAQVLKPNHENLTNIEIESLNSIPATQLKILAEDGYDKFVSISGKNTLAICPKPVEGKTYDLYVWEGEWLKISTTTSQKGKTKFLNVPSNAAYIVLEENGVFKDTRPFIMRENKQFWL
jgi:hypothetical protein